MDSDRKLLSVEEVRHQTGIGRQAIYAAIQDGRLRVLRIGRRIRVPAAEVDAFIAREVERSAAEAL